MNYDEGFGIGSLIVALRERGIELQKLERQQVPSPAARWKDFAIVGMSLHLLFDLSSMASWPVHGCAAETG
ncbi:MAG: hypothetical protein JOZ58_13135 [Acetobacteraceae bacterium]|nr:hypothetical protein [Acetobacteraceae bacterium]